MSSRTPRVSSTTFHSAVVIIGTVAVVTSAAWLLSRESAALAGDRAAAAANAGRWDQALVHAREAAAADPNMPPYDFTLGLAAAHAGDLALARDHMRRAAEIDDFPTAWLNAARLELDLGNRDAARRALAETARLGYQSPEVAIGAMSLYLQLGEQGEATVAAAKAMVVAPGLASDPYWETTAVLSEVWRDAVAMAIDEAEPVVGYHIALEAGDETVAARIVSAIEPDQRRVPDLVARSWSGDTGAFDELHVMAKADPLADEVVAMCRRVAARSRDADWGHADRYDCDGAGTPAALIVVRVSPPPTERVWLPGANTKWHYQYVYRRKTPFDELVPGLPHLYATIV